MSLKSWMSCRVRNVMVTAAGTVLDLSGPRTPKGGKAFVTQGTAGTVLDLSGRSRRCTGDNRQESRR